MLGRALFITTTALSGLALHGCGSAIVDHSSGSPGLTIVSGDHQAGISGETLTSPLVVRLGNASGRPVGGATISWLVLGGGSVPAFYSVTDSEGVASIALTLGVEGRPQEVRATAVVPLPTPTPSSLTEVSFTATTTPTASATALTWTAAQLPPIQSCAKAIWTDIWAAAETDIFVVGGCGTIRHFTGSSWEAQSSGTTHTLWSVWGRSPSDVFVVGDSATVLHSDGTTWSEVSGLPLGDVSGVWGSETGDLFVVTFDSIFKGHVWRHDNAAWTVVFNRPCPLKGIWGSSWSDMFAIGVGFPAWYNGITWKDFGCDPRAGLSDISGGAPAEVYAFGSASDLDHCSRGGGAGRPQS